MPAQFLLNLCIAVLWVFLADEEHFSASVFVTGFLVGIVVVFIMHRYRFFGEKFYILRVYAAIKLILLYIYELIVSGIIVMKHILSPKGELYPGIFKYKTNLKSDWEVSLLAMLLTFSPGSVVMEIDPETNEFYVHAMDIKNYKENLLQFLVKFEKAITEVTR